MKRIISLSLLTLGSLLYADMSTQEFIYKDSRIMGAGGANTAVGGYSTSLFYNPAGLINIKKSHGMEVELLGLGIVSSEGTQEFMNDLSNANTDQETLDAVTKQSGEVFNIGMSNYTSFSYRTESSFAYSIGVLAASDVNLIPHANEGINGLLETHSRVYGGVMLGAAYALTSDITFGVGLKYIQQKSYEVGLTIDEVTRNQDNLATYIQDTYEVDNSGFAVDLGLLYAPMPQSTLNPAFAVSILNIGSLDFDDTYGSQPMTLNFGLAIQPEISWFNSFSLAVDYVDALNAQQVRIRNYNPAYAADQYDSADKEYEPLQHLRVGTSIGLVDNSWFLFKLNGGLYQGAYTAGIDMQLTLLTISAATYQEQLGVTSGQLEDRRYMLNLGIGW